MRLPQPQYNPAQSLDLAALAHPHRASIHYGEVTIGVRQAADVTVALAKLLAQRGVGVNDRVVLVARNSPYHVLLHVACARIGAIFTPVSYRFAGPELAELLDFVGPAVVIADPETARSYAGELPADVFVIDDDEHAPLDSAEATNWERLRDSYAGLLGDLSGELVSADVKPDDGGALLFTSGSTGRPKAVRLTYKQLWWGSQNFREGFEYSHHDVELVTVPLTHIGGFNGTTLDLFSHGGTIVIVREFYPERVLRELERHRVAMMFAVPTIYAALLAHPRFSEFDLSNFRLPLIGGAVCPPALLAKMEERGLRPLNVWGMTEAAASGFMLSQDLLDQARGSIGLPFAHVQARIVDNAGNDAQFGELVISGPNVVGEYWHDVGYSAEAFKDGWLYTGDLARRDEHGFVWIVGRVRYQINTGGEKVIPEEVSNVLIQMPGVSDACVVGIPDPVWGEAVAAALVLDAGADVPQLAEVREFVAQHIARFKAPRHLSVVASLPTNANGKVDMSQVKAFFD
ncbi:AMP-binding protein [Arcanobacterium phocisimile]|uniref:AMP-binding protein n=1 Tax=Arcanobacterium phocisimile TaxID=1302235 RepID=A0ABX7IHF5_9ACTO|nr:AMP-binding protein [Arcanobacterium phocisimile]QRV01889.1 AMP-binding protein [Arcanobacterium phocisimile]